MIRQAGRGSSPLLPNTTPSFCPSTNRRCQARPNRRRQRRVGHRATLVRREVAGVCPGPRVPSADARFGRTDRSGRAGCLRGCAAKGALWGNKVRSTCTGGNTSGTRRSQHETRHPCGAQPLAIWQNPGSADGFDSGRPLRAGRIVVARSRRCPAGDTIPHPGLSDGF